MYFIEKMNITSVYLSIDTTFATISLLLRNTIEFEQVIVVLLALYLIQEANYALNINDWNKRIVYEIYS